MRLQSLNVISKQHEEESQTLQKDVADLQRAQKNANRKIASLQEDLEAADAEKKDHQNFLLDQQKKAEDNSSDQKYN